MSLHSIAPLSPVSPPHTPPFNSMGCSEGCKCPDCIEVENIEAAIDARDSSCQRVRPFFPVGAPMCHTCTNPDFEELICDECIRNAQEEDEKIMTQVAEWSRTMRCNILLRRKAPTWKKVIGKGVCLGVDIREIVANHKQLSHPILDPSKKASTGALKLYEKTSFHKK